MHDRLNDDGSGLWNFSLACYACPDVAEACLQLQDEHGANVNLVLWCMWLEQRGVVLSAENLVRAQHRIHAWDEQFVVPLRRLRRRMKSEFGVADVAIEQVRQHIKRAELAAEKQLQIWLEAEQQAWSTQTASAAAPRVAGENLRTYLAHFKVSEPTISRLLGLFERVLDKRGG